MKNIKRVRVVGIFYEGRQDVVVTMHPGDPIQLVRDPHNPYDPNAISVRTMDNRSLGFIRKELARELAYAFDGYEGVVDGVVVEVDGEYGDGLGMVVEFEVPEDMSGE